MSDEISEYKKYFEFLFVGVGDELLNVHLRRVSTTLRPVVMEFIEFSHLRWAVC
jgi:hypothetical protein